ncbi:DUF1611 domain-containing protein [Aeoliella sp.]|uniref:DUF1611 domain-containing protein n=1 Tax=Aeoliella sp. TaxID=2795800 RepID=UPI003CCBAC83
MRSNRIVILTQGHTNPITAKTAWAVLRYRGGDVAALFDTTQAGKTAGELMGVGGDTPIIGSLDDVDSPDALLIGIAPMGGKLPAEWKPIILSAIARGMEIVSGLHDFLSNDEQLVAAAEQHGVQLVDIRKNNERDVSNRLDLREDCLRIHTVGHDCSIGKMVASVEVANELKRQGQDAKFVATGQTGIMIEGDGCPIDCVVSDFVNGAIEKQILAQQHHDILVIEGQASLAHPRYSAVTAGLLHGCVPHGMIMVFEAGRTTVSGMPHIPLTPLPKLIAAYENLAALHMPSKVIGLAMNGRLLDAQQAEEHRQRVQDETGLVVCDVFRDGAGPLAAEVVKLRAELFGTAVSA